MGRRADRRGRHDADGCSVPARCLVGFWKVPGKCLERPEGPQCVERLSTFDEVDRADFRAGPFADGAERGRAGRAFGPLPEPKSLAGWRAISAFPAPYAISSA